MVDFYINDQLKWLVELVREFYGLDEHIARFEKDGKYYNFAKKCNKWIVLHFAEDTNSNR